MALTISIAQGKGSLNHNNRKIVTKNVDKDRIKDNITYKQESLTEAYDKCFGQVIENYNAKQKRADRKIDGVKGYMEKIRNSGNGEKLFYENVVQVGNMHDCHIGTPEGDLAIEVLDEYMQSFEEQNPNLYVFNAVLHLDEQTPHLHIDYIPLANDYKRGLEIRNSLDKAFKQQGVEIIPNKHKNRTMAWQNAQKDHIGTILKVRGLEPAEESGLKLKHKTVETYKAVAREIDNQVSVLPDQIEVRKPHLINKEKVTVDEKDLEALVKRAKLSTVKDSNLKKLADQELKDENHLLREQNKALSQQNKKLSIALEKTTKAFDKLKAEFDRLTKNLALASRFVRMLSKEFDFPLEIRLKEFRIKDAEEQKESRMKEIKGKLAKTGSFTVEGKATWIGHRGLDDPSKRQKLGITDEEWSDYQSWIKTQQVQEQTEVEKPIRQIEDEGLEL